MASEAAVGIRDHIDVYGEDYPTPDGTRVRDYIHVNDIAAAHVATLAHLGNGGESLTLDFGYGFGERGARRRRARHWAGPRHPLGAAPRR